MKLNELYNQVANPIDDPKVIEKLIHAYVTSQGAYYSKLTNMVTKEHTKGEYFVQDGDRFHAMLFNKWKNSILAMTREEFIELYRQGSYGQDFIKMRKYLKGVPDVTTMKEANEVFYGPKGDKELEKALEHYSWRSFGEGSGWVHVCSRYLTAKKDKYPKADHRLYINTESLDTYKMITYLVEKFDEHHLPYYFKFDLYANRDDTIVIYLPTEEFDEYLKILEAIKKEHPDVVARIKEPPILTGKIDGWIGYGSEPEPTPDGKSRSFNGVRAELLENAIRRETIKFIQDTSLQIKYQGRNMTFTEFVTLKAVEMLLNSLEKKYLSRVESDKRHLKGGEVNYQNIDEHFGYSLQDLHSSSFREMIYQSIKGHIPSLLEKLANKTYTNNDAIHIPVLHGKKIVFSDYNLEQVIKQMAGFISKNSPDFIAKVQNSIKTNARSFGIDDNKFCFDIKATEKINAFEENEKQVKNIANKELDKTHLDDENFLSIINSALLQRQITMPDGSVLSTAEYIKQMVFPHLPANGIVILNDGGMLPIKQFIEEGILFECQEKYNGDLPRYLMDKTQNNVGIITLQIQGQTLEINPLDITKYINPDLLDKMINLPDGTQVSAKKYIEEIYAPYIPMDGKVILANGISIPVRQFIEEVLLWEGQEKYCGDISAILYNLTRNNPGWVCADTEKLQQERDRLSKIKDGLKNDAPGGQKL